MTEKPTGRRRRILLVPLLGLGVAAWAVRSRLVERRTLQEGWQPLPPRPIRPAPVEAAESVDAAEPVAARTRAVPAAAAVASVASTGAGRIGRGGSGCHPSCNVRRSTSRDRTAQAATLRPSNGTSRMRLRRPVGFSVMQHLPRAPKG